MGTSYIYILITLIISVILGYISSVLAGRRKLNKLKTIGVIIIVCFIASGILFLFNNVANTKSNRPNGLWIESYQSIKGRDTLTFYGIAKFGTNPLSGEIYFNGSAYDQTGKFVGIWESESTLLEGKNFRYFYKGDSKTNERKGMGEIKFSTDRNYTEGYGCFRASYEYDNARIFEIEKITELKKLDLMMKSPDKFIREWHKRHISK